MKEIETRLRQGMSRNGIAPAAQEEIILSITSFALYGFPESHAASFALLAYASAYLKCHYLAAFTAALLNNQPMGFYHPATIVKDAQRHGLKVLPVDVTRSDWLCTLERNNQHSAVSTQFTEVSGFGFRVSGESGNASFVHHYSITADRNKEQIPRGLKPTGDDKFKGIQQPADIRSPAPGAQNRGPGRKGLEANLALRLGLRYVRGLREEAGQALVRERSLAPFTSIHDLVRRVPELRKDELNTLAEIGALNVIGDSSSISPWSHGDTEVWGTVHDLPSVSP
jgi:DNA polymerase III alpha subunit